MKKIIWRDIFPDPSAIGESEYRAIHDTIADGVFDGWLPMSTTGLKRKELELVEAMAEQFRDGAEVVLRRIKIAKEKL